MLKLAERFTTYFAFVGSLACVRAVMYSEIISPVEHFITHIAFVVFDGTLPAMFSELWLLHRGWVTGSANVAFITNVFVGLPV